MRTCISKKAKNQFLIIQTVVRNGEEKYENKTYQKKQKNKYSQLLKMINEITERRIEELLFTEKINPFLSLVSVIKQLMDFGELGFDVKIPNPRFLISQ